jgi:hypothetical protein
MSQDLPTPARREIPLHEVLWSDEERTLRWQAYHGSGRVITFTNDNGRVRDFHTNPATEDLAVYYMLNEQYDEFKDMDLPPYCPYFTHPCRRPIPRRS